ncbi:HAD family phosphatase [Candidatus Woesearchaeota archaeon]|nr:HAD family phosphatase [Candidatus Woesearchaeota archaeon]
MIKAVIFDYNGVITNQGDFDGFLAEKAHQSHRPVQEIQQIVKHHWDLAKVGAIDSELIWVHAADYLHCEASELRQEWLSWFGLRKDLLLFIKQLKMKYKTALLTNITRDWFEQAKQEQHLDTYFDVIVSSYEAGAAKPGQKIFEYCLRKLNLGAADCIFIDDQTKNIESAANLGFKTILFLSEDQVKQGLITLGIPLSDFKNDP